MYRSIRRRLLPVKRYLNLKTKNLFLHKPDFVIIGAQKAGTSSLYQYIIQHPEVAPAAQKEVHYFDFHFSLGERWYLNQFPPKYPWANYRITGEASPEYMYLPWAADRLKDFLPGTKLIALLRNPVERAISHYYFEIRRKPRIETLPIMDALLAEDERMAEVMQEIKNGDFAYSLLLRRLAYKKRGIYHEQLRNFEHYKNSGQLLIIQSEDFFEDPQSTLEQVYHYLNIDTGFKCPDLSPKNIGTNRSSVTNEVYEYLEDFFIQHNRLLYDYLGIEFAW